MEEITDYAAPPSDLCIYKGIMIQIRPLLPEQGWNKAEEESWILSTCIIPKSAKDVDTTIVFMHLEAEMSI